MELILTGKSFSGVEAERWGVAARAFEDYASLMEGTLKTAETIASYSKVAVQACKEVVNKSQDLPLRDEVEYEAGLPCSLWQPRPEDRDDGICGKRKPDWSHE